MSERSTKVKANILDTVDTEKNPATEEKQDDIISALTGTSGNYSVNIKVKSDDANIKYIGLSAIGTATSSATWQILRVDKTSGTVIFWADGNDNFDNIFDNRESLTFS